MNDVIFCCDQMKLAVQGEEFPVVYIPGFREYGIKIYNKGGGGFLELRFCPWCGKKLPGSLRDLWFDTLESKGIDPYSHWNPKLNKEIPKEFLDESWHEGRTDL